MAKEDIGPKLNVSYLTLRRMIGILGLALPAILIFVNILLHGSEKAWQSSISHYYFSSGTVIFTGILISFGLLLISYRGYDPDPKLGERVSDNRWTNIAGVMALIVALVPTTPDERVIFPLSPNAHSESTLSLLHLAASASFFLIMGWVFLVKFTLMSPEARAARTNQQLKRDQLRSQIYTICAYGIWAGLVFCLVVFTMEDNGRLPHVLNEFGILIGEIIMLVFLGVGWLVKSDSFNDIISRMANKNTSEEPV